MAAADLVAALSGICFLGFGSADRKCAGNGHMDIEKPRAASPWLRTVECERACGILCASIGVPSAMIHFTEK